MDCDHCGARRCIYSNNSVGKNNGPSKEDEKSLLNLKDNGYVCGNKPGAENYMMRRLLRCGDQVETQYYNSEIITGKPTNGRVLTELICCLCYDSHHIFSPGEIKRMPYAIGKNLLSLCGQCFESALELKISVLTTKRSSNQRENGTQKRAYKNIIHSKAVSKGYNKRSK